MILNEDLFEDIKKPRVIPNRNEWPDKFKVDGLDACEAITNNRRFTHLKAKERRGILDDSEKLELDFYRYIRQEDVNESLKESDEKSFKLRFYKLKGADKGNLDHEEFFDTKNQAVDRYREVFKKELYSYNPTVWQLKDGDWKRLMNHEIVKESIKEALNLNDYGDCYVELCDGKPIFCYDSYSDARYGVSMDRMGDWQFDNGTHKYEIKRWENKKLKDIDESLKEDLEEYALIQTEDWYDPEGLDIPRDGIIRYIGSIEECEDELDALAQKYKDKASKPWSRIYIEHKNDTEMSVYFANAKAREHFNVVPYDIEKFKSYRKGLTSYINEDLEGPLTPEDNGVAKLLLQAINDESDTIQFYNDLLANTDNEDIIAIINDINEEENNHIGMLSKALAIVSPNAEAIEDGQEEAEEMIAEVDEEPVLAPVDESLNEKLESGDKRDLTILNQRIQDELGDMLYIVDKEHLEARKKLVKASFLVSEAVDDCLDIDESLGEKFTIMKIADGVYSVGRGNPPIANARMRIEAGSPEEAKEILMKNGFKEDELVYESLNEDLHDKFKRDIKAEYKSWANKVERAEAKRKEAMEMIPDNATDEQIAKYTEFVNDMYPMPKFDYEFPHSLEKDDYPYYVTYYAQYPIYEPAEGGYYYAGQDAMNSKGFNSREEAQAYADQLVSEDDYIDNWEKYSDGYLSSGKYIGQDQKIVIEPRKGYLSGIKGWEPYQ